MSESDLKSRVEALARRAKAASRALAAAPTERKNAVLTRVAALLRADADAVLDANGADVAAAREAGLSSAMVDRLRLDRDRLEGVE